MKEWIKRGLIAVYALCAWLWIDLVGGVLKSPAVLAPFRYKLYRRLRRLSKRAYLACKRICEARAVERLQRQGHIRVAFVAYTGSMWFLDELYERLKADPRFEVAVLVGRLLLASREASEREFEQTLQFFRDKAYDVVGAEAAPRYDVLFYLTPYWFADEALNLPDARLRQLVYHVSYSYMLAGNMEKLKLDMYHWSYRYYTDSKYYLDLLSTRVEEYSGNARYVGFPKMDRYYSLPEGRVSEKKVIIYAPHHSVTYTEFKSATFEENHAFMLEMAKKYRERVFWVYKPHPLLRDRCVEARIFPTIEAYDDYVRQWASLENAVVAESGSYLEWFKASDAMITDSISFLAEYQFTGNPLLLLVSGAERYNAFGESVVEVLYRCPGRDFERIEAFVRDVLDGTDPQKEARAAFFRSNLDYIGARGETANRAIYREMCETFFPERG